MLQTSTFNEQYIFQLMHTNNTLSLHAQFMKATVRQVMLAAKAVIIVTLPINCQSGMKNKMPRAKVEILPDTG